MSSEAARVYRLKRSGRTSRFGSGGREKPHGSDVVLKEVAVVGFSSGLRQDPGSESGVSKKAGFWVAVSPPDEPVL